MVTLYRKGEEMNIFKNEKKLPERYFARHIKEGVVHYLEKGQDNIYLVTNEALKKMNKSFEGKPVYVRHVDKVDVDNLREKADGYVVKSFYNEFDGAWWAEIIVVSDEGHEAVEKGWAVSNAYLPTELGVGGSYHDISYQKEVKNGVYDHLALVDNPRYEEAVIMTPEEFKNFNEGRKQELEQLKNSKENEMLSKEDMESLVATLKNSLKEEVKNAVNECLAEEKKNAEEKDHRELIREIAAISAKPEEDFDGGMEEKVRTIIGLAEKLGYSKDEAGKNAKKNDDNPAPKGDEDASHEREGDLINKRKNEDEEKEDKEEKKENSKGFFSALKNARNKKDDKYVPTMASGLALGKKRYGSN